MHMPSDIDSQRLIDLIYQLVPDAPVLDIPEFLDGSMDPARRIRMLTQILLLTTFKRDLHAISHLQIVNGDLLYVPTALIGRKVVHGLTIYEAKEGCQINGLVILDGGIPCWVENPIRKTDESTSCVVVAGVRGKAYPACSIQHLFVQNGQPCYLVHPEQGNDLSCFVVQGTEEGEKRRWINAFQMIDGLPLYHTGTRVDQQRSLVWGTETIVTAHLIGKPMAFKQGFIAWMRREPNGPETVEYFAKNEHKVLHQSGAIRDPMILRRDRAEELIVATADQHDKPYRIIGEGGTIATGKLIKWDPDPCHNGKWLLYSLETDEGPRTFVNFQCVFHGSYDRESIHLRADRYLCMRTSEGAQKEVDLLPFILGREIIPT